MMNLIKSLMILIEQKKNKPKKEEELNNVKMGLIKKREIDKDKNREPTKKTRTNEAKSFKDQIRESLYPLEQISADLDIEEMLLKIDNDKINNLSKKLKK